MPRPKQPKPLKKNHYWSLFEKSILRRYYPDGGRRMVQRMLAAKGYYRSLDSIYRKARQMKLYHEPVPEDYILIAHVHPAWNGDTTHSSRFVKRRAREDGVLRVFSHGGQDRLAVPTEWADTYVEEAGRRMQADRSRSGSWLTSRDAAELFGVTDGYLGNARLRPERYPRLAQFLGRATCEEGLSTIYWEPSSTRAAAHAYRSWRRTSKQARCYSEPEQPAALPARKAA